MKYRIKDYEDIRQQVEKMSVDQLLSCVICPDYAVDKVTPDSNILSLMFHPTDVKTAARAGMELNGNRENKALIVADMEYGAGKAVIGAVEFPSMRAVAEAGDERLAYDMGIHAAKEARLAGYHWTFGPCVDILGNKRNPIVSIRTAGEDADTVIRYGGAYMRGLQDGGLIATLKHFPGDGYCENDQHITTPDNLMSREEWDASFGRVYQTLIEDGAMAIMPGHITLPSYDEIDEETGIYPPATLSRNLLTELLKNKLGFEGIIISDAIIMNGFCGYMNFYRASARFLEAGGDSLLFMHPTEEYFSSMKALIDEGALTVETLKNRAYRMLCFSRQYFEEHPATEPVAFDRKAAEACAAEVVTKSMSVVRDRKGTLPLKKNARIAHVILGNAGMSTASVGAAEDLTRQLRERGLQVEELKDPGGSATKRMAKSGEYDVILCSVINEMVFGLNVVKLAGPVARNMMSGWMRYGTPAVFISYFDPYFGDDFYACTDALINTYGYTNCTNKQIIKKLFGE
ncbi:MAG: hypothetical protein IJW44_00255 [Clostridia bacterium]|nr:hypothetical protein [Clostridia bacterium]